MKGIQKFYSKAMLYLKRSSPTILTCVGAAGVIATAVMAVKATPKAMRICAVLKSIRTDDYEEEPTKFEYALAAWRCYIPSAIMGLSTISCIFGANALNKRQQAAITSAYILMENAYKEYKNKAKELLGDKTDFQIREAVAKGKYNECHPAVEKKTIVLYGILRKIF
jgi:hypothetical protein